MGVGGDGLSDIPKVEIRRPPRNVKNDEISQKNERKKSYTTQHNFTFLFSSIVRSYRLTTFM